MEKLEEKSEKIEKMVDYRDHSGEQLMLIVFSFMKMHIHEWMVKVGPSPGECNLFVNVPVCRYSVSTLYQNVICNNWKTIAC